MAQKTALNQALRAIKNHAYPNRMIKRYLADRYTSPKPSYSQEGEDLLIDRVFETVL